MSDTATATLDAVPEEAREASPAWAAVVSLSLGVFGLVTAEFLPASLLTGMASDLNVSAGAAGQTVTATAVVACIAAVTLSIITRNIDRRLVLWSLTVLLIVSDLLAATANGLGTLLVARVLLGISLGGFWSMAAAIAMRLVPARLVPRALSVVFTGVSVATVCAAPVGAYVGDIWGWRMAFFIAAAVGIVTLIVQVATMPKLPPVAPSSFRNSLDLFKRPAIRIGLLSLLVIISGHFAGFTYIRPFLEQVPALGIEAVSLTLLGFGVAGFFGNFAGAFIVERSIKWAIILGALTIAGMAFVMMAYGNSALLSGVAVTVWGFAFAFLPIGFQTWTVTAASDQAEAAGGLLVAAFQIAITAGAVFGGLLVDGLGPLGAIAYAGLTTLVGAAIIMIFAGKVQPQRE